MPAGFDMSFTGISNDTWHVHVSRRDGQRLFLAYRLSQQAISPIVQLARRL